MSGRGSVTNWLQQISDGVEGDAQQEIWERYFHRLAALARSKIRNLGGCEDEEDIALSALKSFYIRAADNRFPLLTDRTALWPLLVRITVCKVVDAQRRQLAECRDARRTASMEAFIEEEPTPEFAATICDEVNEFLEGLSDESQRRIAALKLEGYTNQEVAERIGVSLSTVERKLRTMRRQLAEEYDQ